MTACRVCHHEFSDAHYQRVVYGTAPLYGPWHGWRTAGRYLVAPSGERLTVERVLGLLWAEKNRRRIPVDGNQTTVLLDRVKRSIPARERFEGSA
ncbi:hypothetical protein [Pseudoluteimonas lycopersici]|uniref:hypothetical protein n=1 Tax=Pseudoluteimonas lycopersici TaxID=1324796 RepID=UPI00163D62E8